MLRKALFIGIFSITAIPWSGIFAAACIDNIESSPIIGLLKKNESSKSKKSPAKLSAPPESSPELAFIKVFHLDSELTWDKAVSSLSRSDSFLKLLKTSRVLSSPLPRGTTIFQHKSLRTQTAAHFIAALLPNQRVHVLQRNSSGTWEFRIFSGYQRQIVGYAGFVESTLWESAIQEGMDPGLLDQLSQAFSSRFDLNRDTKQGDQWRLLAEGLYINDKLIGWNRILGAQYKSGQGLKTAIQFQAPGSESGYFGLKGENLRTTILASPLRMSHVTSGFSWARFHPVLGHIKPHLGVDLSAPSGTPVLAIADGTVSFIGENSISGKLIKIAHGPSRETRYLHLSKVSSRNYVGRKVGAGDIIGFVGSTGLTTGPHLHFEFWLDGKVVDPSRHNLEKVKLLPREYHSKYQTRLNEIIASLPKWKLRPATGKVAAITTHPQPIAVASQPST